MDKMDHEEKHDRKYVPPLARAQLIFELLAFALCLLVTASQLGLLDYYFVIYGEDQLWLLWIIADCLVLGVMCWVFHFALTYSRRCLRQPCKDEANLRFAFVVWFVYSVVLSAKIATFFAKFSTQLTPKEAGDTGTLHLVETTAQKWGPIVLKFILGLSAVIFLLLVLSHHYNRLNNPRALFLSYLSSSVSIDLLDSVLFLELLVEPTISQKLRSKQALQIVIIIFACVNFVLPTLALFKLRYRKGLPSWVPLPYEKLYALFYFLLVNVPYLVIRAYLWRREDHDVSIFMLKNAIMIAVGLRDVWVGFLLWREKKALRAHHLAGGSDPYNTNNGNGGGEQQQQNQADSTSADRLR